MEIRANLEKLLTDALGFNTAIVGQAGMERIVQAAMRRLGITDEAAYLELLARSPEEFENCLEELLVPETWFFRDQEPFSLLKQHLVSQISAQPNSQVRILSVPCSTGEEPYSIAMTLLEAGIHPDQFHLDAADISRRSLAAADRAVYGRSAFRQPLTKAQEAFFSGPPEARRLAETVVRVVRFQRANLIDPGFLAGQAPYHIIFCRNVLIYLTDEARRLAFAHLDRLLAPEGMLFTGHAELALLQQQGYGAVSHARSFACRRTPPGAMGDRFEICPPLPPLPPICPPPPRPHHSATPAPTPIPSAPATEVSDLHARAVALADRGLFDEAAALCRQYLAEQPPRADLYCLLGLIHEGARRIDEAADCYEKALYLDPDHYETLIHLSLLRRQQGNGIQAARYQKRAEATERRPNGTDAP